MRLDKYLFDNQLSVSRTQAVDLIKSGLVTVNGKVILKPSFLLENDLDSGETNLENDLGTNSENNLGSSFKVKVKTNSQFVSRAGNKLNDFIINNGIGVSGKVCLDAGAGKGGFTESLLKNGAKLVYAVDVGTAQLDQLLVDNPAVIEMSNTNIKDLEPAQLSQSPEVITVDLSFISLTNVIDVLLQLGTSECQYIFLVKPQFEVGKKNLGKSGVTSNKEKISEALTKINKTLKEKNLKTITIDESSVKGKKGNQEYLIWAVKNS
jgi:23S rRNA (cytidine1920-2'-O)/16S rRNA (cytidine1409-2'-O)-methyltransferase